VPVPRHRDVDRRDQLHEDVRLIVPLASRATTLADVEREPWAAGQPGSGHAAAVENVCNRIGGYAPQIRHRSDDALILRALVSAGQAVTLLPALIATATPGIAAHPIPGLNRTIFTAVRAAAAEAPAIAAVREALAAAARAATAARPPAPSRASAPGPPRGGA
jgi:DNA-binding transcriptional LysR family regulator